MAVRYIGSKARLVAKILEIVGPPGPDAGYFVDAFTGTGAVAAAAADAGWDVRVNDSLYCATVLATGQVLSQKQARFTCRGGYAAAIADLNATPGRDGFIWHEYSPASGGHCEVERRYFTEENARKIDGIRTQIAEWAEAGELTKAEEQLLVADLLVAANRVANIAGTYGCFLRQFSANSLAPLSLVCRTLRASGNRIDVLCQDVYDVPSSAQDVVYYDPPYTKRQYAAYYHILETIAAGDSPEVGGVTGLRPWQAKASVFCYKTKALSALADLVAATDARRILLSYSDEGHVSLEELLPRLLPLGDVTVHTLAEIGRYRPNQQAAEARSSVHEFLVEIVKTDAVEPLTPSFDEEGAGAPSLALVG